MEMQEAVLHRTGVKQRWREASVSDQQSRRGPAAACLHRQKSTLEETPAGPTVGRSLVGAEIAQEKRSEGSKPALLAQPSLLKTVKNPRLVRSQGALLSIPPTAVNTEMVLSPHFAVSFAQVTRAANQLIRVGLEGKPRLAAGLAPLRARSHLYTTSCREIARMPWSQFLLETSDSGAQSPHPPPARRGCLQEAAEAAGPPRHQSARTAPPRGHSRAAARPRLPTPVQPLPLRAAGATRASPGSTFSLNRPGRSPRGSEAGHGSLGGPWSAPAPAGSPRVRVGRPGARVRSGGLAAGLRGALGLRRSGRGRTWTTLLLAAFAAVLHWSHITHLFENDRHFSHLSTLEREMAFRTEMGLYYSYFKTIVEAPSFLNGVWMIMNDKLTEYPLVINTLKRFNLYPEVILASWYRIYTKIMDLIGIQTKICWTVTRGEGLSPIESCEGLGDPACFYVAVIFILNGLMMALFFIYGTYLSGSRLGGLVTVLCFFFNHGECTRVMWTPPLRESFSYPFLVLQMLLVTHILRATKLHRGSLIALCISNVFFMLPWQFAQFVLLTQIASLFALYVVGYIDISKLRKITYMHMISLALCFVLMFGNSMLLTSYYASSLVIIWGLLAMKPYFLKINVSELTLWVIQGCFWLFGTVILKYLTSKIFGIADDAHIGNLLTSKFFSYKDFDTLLYTCAAEFDFMEKETPLRYTKTLLLPVVLVVFVVIIRKVVSDMWVVLTKQQTHIRKHQFDHGELVYHALQLLAYTVLGVLIMRLKLFLTPHMCVMASLICSRQLFGWLFCKVHPGAVVFAVLAAMSIQGSANLQTQWNIVGEFSNLPQEELIEWIKYSTKPDAVFAGAMPTMASVKLSALRPIVNHPHYEDAGLRARTKIVYSMYSRKAAEEVKRELIKLQVNYYILEESWCIRRSKPGCSMPEIWDVEDPANAGKPPLCNLLVKESKPHFTTVFQNSVYKVLEVIEE
nr:probable C-mannosyltransferase DPY19L1 [Odocoileus virginianus texanus]